MFNQIIFGSEDEEGFSSDNKGQTRRKRVEDILGKAPIGILMGNIPDYEELKFEPLFVHTSNGRINGVYLNPAHKFDYFGLSEVPERIAMGFILSREPYCYLLRRGNNRTSNNLDLDMRTPGKHFIEYKFRLGISAEKFIDVHGRPLFEVTK